MNKILKITAILAVVVLFTTSCGKDFLRQPNPGALTEETALLSATDVQNAVVGAYSGSTSVYGLTSHFFFGRNAQGIIDVMGDLTGFNGGNNNGHLNAFESYTYLATTADVNDLWLSGYRVIDRSTRAIKAGKRILGEGVSAADQQILNMSLGQAYGLKALCHFYLVNTFAYPYTYLPNSPGVVLVGDEPITVATSVSRATVSATYDHILQDIASAKAYFTAGAGGAYPAAEEKFFMNEAAVYALEARVLLYMANNWSGAVTAAETALSKSGAAVQTDDASYIDMWAINSAATIEDIFTLNYGTATALSASSMATLYGSYGGAVYTNGLALYGPDDIRQGLFSDKATATPNAKSMAKYPNTNAVNNNPIFRASEMYLIIAEAKAQLNQLTEAKTALFEVAQRNKAIADAASIPAATQAELLAFIADERARELMLEGHRWFDLRRRGDIMSRTQGITLKDITNFDVKKCVLPIPNTEVVVSKIAQNDWVEGLPE